MVWNMSWSSAFASSSSVSIFICGFTAFRAAKLVQKIHIPPLGPPFFAPAPTGGGSPGASDRKPRGMAMAVATDAKIPDKQSSENRACAAKAHRAANTPFSAQNRNQMSLSALTIVTMVFAPQNASRARLLAPESACQTAVFALRKRPFGTAIQPVSPPQTAHIAQQRPPQAARRSLFPALPKLFRRAARVLFLMKNVYPESVIRLQPDFVLLADRLIFGFV